MSARIVRALEIGLFPVLWITKGLLAIPAAWWKRIGLTVVSASFGLVVWSRFNAPHGTLNLQPWTTVSSPSVVYFIAPMVCVMTLYVGGVWVFDPAMVATVRQIARALPVRGKGALAVARHTLESRRAFDRRDFWRSKAELGGLAVMAAVVSMYLAGFTIDRAQSERVAAVAFDAVVSPAGVAPLDSPDIGVDRAAIDSAVIAGLEEDPRLAVVPFGLVTVGPVGAVTPEATLTVVSPGALTRVTPDGARPAGFQDGVLLSPDLEDFSRMLPAPAGIVDVSSGTGSATLFHRHWLNANTFATRSWAEATWGEVPVVGALVEYVGDDIPAADRLGYIDDAARRLGASTRPAPALDPNDVAFGRSMHDFSRGTLGVMSAFIAIAASISVIIIAVRNVRVHRQVRATVAALGATPRALALAVPIDAGIALGVAFAIGYPLGAVIGAVAKHPTLLTIGAPCDPGETAWGLWWNLTHIAWGQLATVGAATWGLAVAATAVYGFRVARRTPVDELREAIKQGTP